ncbi:NADH:flavin oxidoreductase [Congregibacter litoralis]|uniref:NADH:flavin oxidoreductase, Old Yellow Enzyme family n=1 Tax=Congregibacter litoralis KT71 TaxID=314285 RepID=A4AAU3_9GAMM|nr:NADH:flavin oxidoreductase [Congregibacter litoralis]EAQ96815.1 NADH:flavin oxidoreductase, Old Yellow Enzyme family [Congregibacter litoralis KT71]
MASLSDALTFKSGAIMPNRFMLAPLTNLQSHSDGTLSDDEYRWLSKRAEGGFGLTMTCASHVQAVGCGFPGQLGCFSDEHLEGLGRLAAAINAEGSVSVLQLHHAGMRSPEALIGEQPHCPSDNEKTGARGLSHEEVLRLRDDFIAAAVRAQKAGFTGVELHGAHGYVLAQFLSPTINLRDDEYGGSLENRSRLLLEIIDGVRERCGADFLLGVRLSAERFDIRLAEMRDLAQQLMREGNIDFLDMSLWDSFKEPEEEGFEGKTLLECFTELDRGDVLLGTAGKIRSAEDARRCIEAGADFAVVGRSAILHHDFPRRVLSDPAFQPVSNPVTAEYLRKEGLGEAFIEYMASWKGFVEA